MLRENTPPKATKVTVKKMKAPMITWLLSWVKVHVSSSMPMTPIEIVMSNISVPQIRWTIMYVLQFFLKYLLLAA